MVSLLTIISSISNLPKILSEVRTSVTPIEILDVPSKIWRTPVFNVIPWLKLNLFVLCCQSIDLSVVPLITIPPSFAILSLDDPTVNTALESEPFPLIVSLKTRDDEAIDTTVTPEPRSKLPEALVNVTPILGTILSVGKTLVTTFWF